VRGKTTLAAPSGGSTVAGFLPHAETDMMQKSIMPVITNSLVITARRLLGCAAALDDATQFIQAFVHTIANSFDRLAVALGHGVRDVADVGKALFHRLLADFEIGRAHV
jgi:hypothetical protein